MARVREELTASGEAIIPGLGTLRTREKHSGGLVVVMHRWADDMGLAEDVLPRPPVTPCVSALLEDVRQWGPVHVRGLGIIGQQVLPEYHGRNPRTGEVIVVPEKSLFTCLPDEELERFLHPRTAE